jgi:formate dehydrogenase maturation protein FdhE
MEKTTKIEGVKPRPVTAREVCPKCNSKDITEFIDEERDIHELASLSECQICRAEWWEVFKFSHIEIVGE